MAMKCHEDGRQNTLSMVFAGDSAPHHFQNFIFLRRVVFILIFSVPWPTARHCSFSEHIDMLGQCLAEQLWVGQAIDACLYTATNEAFAPCSQLINLLRSSNFTLSSLLLSSHFASELRATVFDLFKFQRPSQIFRGTFPAKTSICEIFFELWSTTCLPKLHSHFLQAALRRGEQVSMELSRSKSDWCHVVSFPARECSTESRVAAAFLDVSLSTLWSGPWRWPNPFWPGIFSTKLRPFLPAALSFVTSNWKMYWFYFAIKSVVNDQCDMKNI